MSITTKAVDAEGECLNHPCHGIEMVIQPTEKDLGGFSVRRVLPYATRKMLGPWIFFDHMGPVRFEPENGIDVRPHPHINLATVTYLFEGEILHRDSLGNAQIIRPGDINLMVAGRGIAHSERTPPALRSQSHCLHGLQLWLALPKELQEIEPMFYHHETKQLPTIIVEDVSIRVMMGSAFDVSSPVKCHSKTLYFEATLKQNQTIQLPSHVQERGVYVINGKLKIDQVELIAHAFTIFEKGASIELTALEETKIVVIGGDPIGDRYIWWNFASDTKERIEQAKQDWRLGKFPKVLGDEVEYIPLPT